MEKIKEIKLKKRNSGVSLKLLLIIGLFSLLVTVGLIIIK